MKHVNNEFRIFIDDELGCVEYMLVDAYTNGGYHINIHRANNLPHAHLMARLIAEELDIELVSINEGYYK